MIDYEKIEEAAIEYIDDEGRGFEAFIAGAEWAINEFLKDLWHPAIETPDLDKRILYEYKPNGEINPPTHIKEATYEKVHLKKCGYKPINPEQTITRWLYIDDLLPKEVNNEVDRFCMSNHYICNHITYYL